MKLPRFAGPVLLLVAVLAAGAGGPSSKVLAGAPIVTFDICLQDDSNHNFLQFNSTTGAFQFFSCPNLVASGTGTVTKKGCVITLVANTQNRRLNAQITTCAKAGTASLNVFSGGQFTIQDRNTANSTCTCGTPPPAS